jgi:hypothetical protein
MMRRLKSSVFSWVGVTACDSAQHPHEIQSGAHPARGRAADADNCLYGLAGPGVVTNVAGDLARETAVGQACVVQEHPVAGRPSRRKVVWSAP